MKALLIVSFGALSGWLFYERSHLKDEVTHLHDNISKTQTELDQTKRTGDLAMAELTKLSPERAALIGKLGQQPSVLSQKQAELDRLPKKKTWLQDEIDHRSNPLEPKSNHQGGRRP